jgi:hypothetical protein
MLRSTSLILKEIEASRAAAFHGLFRWLCRGRAVCSPGSNCLPHLVADRLALAAYLSFVPIAESPKFLLGRFSHRTVR